MSKRQRIGSIALGLLAAVTMRQPGLAACNLIPQTEKSFDAARGAVTRPFAAPGEPIELRLRPCDGPAPVLGPSPANRLVTVVFEPTGNGAKHAVVLTAAADCSAVTPLLAACNAQLGVGGNSQCASGSTAGMQIVQRNNTDYLRFNFPDSAALFGGALAGPASIAVTDAAPAALPCQLATSTCAQQSGLIACVDSLFANDGNCGRSTPQGTFNHFTALPVPNDFAAGCWDTIPPCSLSSSQFRMTTDSDGNILVPMDWRGILVRQNQVPVPRLLSASIASPVPLLGIHIPGKSFVASFTPEGGLLPPIFEPEAAAGTADGVATLFGSADAPYTILRLARRSDTFQACSGGGNGGLPCNDANDCPGGVCASTSCFGGARNGLACSSDGGCPGGECGPEIVDLRALGNNGNGPVSLNRIGAGVCQEDPAIACSMASECNLGMGNCVSYALTAEYPVPLDGLAETPDVFAFSVNEAVDLVPRNGDGDSRDTVLLIRDRTSGAALPMPGPAPGRAVVRITEAPFTFPAVASENNLIAFLESEAMQGAPNSPVILNADGDSDDSILRVLREEPSQTLTEITANLTPPLAVDAQLRIDHRSLAVSNGRVFFRVPEDGAMTARTRRVTNGTMGQEPNNNSVTLSPAHGQSGPQAGFSADGRYLVFNSKASNLVAGGTGPGRWHVYLYDRDVDDDGIFDEVGQTSTTLITRIGGIEANSTSDHQTISADGRFVVFRSMATNLVSVPGSCPNAWSGMAEPNNCAQIVLYDRVADNFELVSRSSGNVAADGDSFYPSISADGRFVAFQSHAANLVSGDTNTCGAWLNPGQCPDVFVRDRCLSHGDPVPGCSPSTIRASLSDSGAQSPNGAVAPTISWDGTRVAFTTTSPLVANDIDGNDAVYLRDLSRGSTELISIDSITGFAGNGFNAFISGDGDSVAFISTSPLTANSPGGLQTFVYSRRTGATELLSISSAGDGTNSSSNVTPVLSYDGRYAAFYSVAPNLVANDTNVCLAGDTPGECPDYFVRDRVAGTTRRASVTDAGGNSDYQTPWGILSPDGRTVAFATGASNLLGPGGDTNASCDDYNADMIPDNCADVYLRTLDWDTSGGHDRTGDGDATDTVLAVLDTAQPNPTPILLCAADDASVVAGAVAFLRPEVAGPSGNAPCTGGTLTGPVLNGDADTDDLVVHFASSANVVQNLGRAATAIALSGLCTSGSHVNQACRADADCPGGACDARYVAALVSESGQGANLNGDNDLVPDDDVAQVYGLSDAAPAWANLAVAADSLDAFGSLVAFVAPEAGQNADLDGDGDKLDRVLHVYDTASATRTNTRQAAEEFVIGGSIGECGNSPLVAFRTSEAAQGNADLNGDGDSNDYVLQLYAKGIGVVNTAQAVTPCRLEACDPRQPYRVYGSQVKFLTFEVEQGADLNGDGDATDLVLQVYDACKREVRSVTTIDYDSPTATTSAQASDPLEQDPARTGQAVVTPGKRCMQGSTILLTPSTCEVLADCPSTATACTDDLVVAAPAAISRHDTVLLPLKPMKVTIPVSGAEVLKTLSIKVRNGDVPEQTGHVVQLSVEPGDCPPLIVDGLPDFDSKTAGEQPTTRIAGGKTKSAKVRLRFKDTDFTPRNGKAPQRCTLLVRATTLAQNNEDPTPRNGVQSLEVNVTDRSDAAVSSTHESLTVSLAPVKLSIGRSAASANKTVSLKLTNADPADGLSGHAIAVGVDQGDCPATTVSVQPPTSVTVPGSASSTMKLAVNVASHALAVGNAKSPGRCTAAITATTSVPGNLEPDNSNNTTRLMIEVDDKTQY